MSRLIFHKFDPLVPAPGGIDTCIRGIIKYGPDEGLLIVGVDGTNDPARRLGKWENHTFAGRDFRFMPVSRLDPGNQVRRVPHSVNIALGALRYRAAVPRVDVVQSHRADLALVGQLLWPRPKRDYFIHTQESGILGSSSDSFWKRAGSVHRAIEKLVVRRSDRVRVFNPSYAPVVAQWNTETKFSPTWWDPELVLTESERVDDNLLLWVGRVEQPKRPWLAIDALVSLIEDRPDEPWRLRIVGGGNLTTELERRIRTEGLEKRVTLVGRLSPSEVMREMSQARVLLMTSVEGYEGYPRVLVEGLASGLVAVVTAGSDTGALVVDGVNGFHAHADGASIGSLIARVHEIDSAQPRRSVTHLSAPVVVSALYK